MNINERLEQKPDIYRCTGSNSDRRGFYAMIQINLGTVLLRGLHFAGQAAGAASWVRIPTAYTKYRFSQKGIAYGGEKTLIITEHKDSL